MDSGDAIIGALIAGAIALNIFLMYLIYLTFNHLIACDGIGAVVGFGLLFLVLCAVEIAVIGMTGMFFLALID